MIKFSRWVPKDESIALICFSYFILATLVTQFLRTDYSYLKTYLSYYAVGPYGLIMSTGFFSLALGSWFLSNNLSRSLTPIAYKIAVLGIRIWSVAGVFVAIFGTDIGTSNPTTSGNIHNAAAIIAFASISISAILFSLKEMTYKEAPRGLSFLLGLFVPLSLATFYYFTSIEYRGIVEKVFIVGAMFWMTSLILNPTIHK